MTRRSFIDAGRERCHRLAESNPATVFRVHPWVLWWFYFGVVCGVVAVANILFRNLTRTQERILLVVGIMHWLLGGLVCWACEGIRTEKPKPPPIETRVESKPPEKEWHPASDFLLPGGGHTLLPPSHAHRSRELVEAFALQHREERHHGA